MGGPHVELEELIRKLAAMSPADIREVADAVASHLDSPAAEVAWWQATLAIDGALRRHGRSRTAARAGFDASRAVLSAADRAGISLPDDEVTSAARAARELARGLVAGEPAGPAVTYLMTSWSAVLGTVDLRDDRFRTGWGRAVVSG